MKTGETMVKGSKKDKVRLTIDLPIDEHKYFKILCTTLGLSMQDLASHVIHQFLEEYEDKLDLSLAIQTLTEIKKGKDKPINYDKFRKDLGL